jgi:hypothetical protein
LTTEKLETFEATIKEDNKKDIENVRAEMNEIKELTIATKEEIRSLKNDLSTQLESLQAKFDDLKGEVVNLSPRDPAHERFKLYETSLGQIRSLIDNLGSIEIPSIAELKLLKEYLESEKVIGKVLEAHPNKKINLPELPPTLRRLVKTFDNWNPKAEAGKQNYTGILVSLIALAGLMYTLDAMLKPAAESANNLEKTLKLLNEKLKELKEMPKDELSANQKLRIDAKIADIEKQIGLTKPILNNLVIALHKQKTEHLIEEGLKMRNVRMDRDNPESDFLSDRISPQYASALPGGRTAVAYISYSNELYEINTLFNKIDDGMLAIKAEIQNG